jgi:hypothetical protein
MTPLLEYPDIASYQTGISLAGQQAVCVKATEDGGNTQDRYQNPDYTRAMAEATRLGLVKMAYHFLRKDNPAGEADYAFSIIGHGVATMIDAEASQVNVADILAFHHEYRARGGLSRLVYLPRWYWSDLGEPDLSPLVSAGLGLVSSNYQSATDPTNGPGWQPYGGMTPVISQFTNNGTVNGRFVDLNAFRGTVGQLHWYLYGPSEPLPTPATPPFPGRLLILRTPLMQGGDVQLWQQRMHDRGWSIAVDATYGPASATVCREFQQDSNAHGWPLLVDGEVGPKTWAAAWQRPISR